MFANTIIKQFLTQIIGLVTGVVLSVIASRILGVAGRGNFAILLNSSSFLNLVLGFSLASATVNIISSNKAPLRNTINTFVLAIVLVTLLCGLVLVVFPFYKFDFLLPKQINVVHSQFILLVLFVSTIFNVFFNSILSANKLFETQQRTSIALALLSLVLNFILFYFHKQHSISFQAFIIFYVCMNVFPTLVTYVVYYINIRPVFKFSFLTLQQIKFAINFSFLAYLANVFQFLSYRMDFWFVEHYSGSLQLGIYSLAVNLAQLLWLLPQAISSILIVYSGANKTTEIIQQTNRLCRIAFNAISGVAALLLCTIQFLIPLLYGAEYAASSLLFKLLLVGIVPFTLTTIIAAYFAGQGNVKVNLICSLIGFCVCFILDIVLIPSLGNIGATLATVASYFASTLYILVMYTKTTGSTIGSIIRVNNTDLLLMKNKLNFIKNSLNIK